jgi:hypothetical protein
MMFETIIIDGLAQKPSCKNCEFWYVKEDKGDRYGESRLCLHAKCVFIGDETPPDDGFGAIDCENFSASIYTGPDFCCNLFQWKVKVE